MRYAKPWQAVLILLAISIAFSGCAQTEKPAATPTPAPKETPMPEATPVATPEKVEYKFKMTTGSPTGTYYIALTSMASVVSKYNPDIYATAIPGGGSAANARGVGSGKVPISLSTSMVAYFAYTGTGTFEGEKYPKLRSMALAHPLIVSFIVKSDSDINTIYDLKGKRVAIGEAGSGDAVAAEVVLKEAGIWDDVIKVNVGDPESWNMVKLGTVDAAIHHTSLPNPNLYELSMSTPIKLIEIPDELAEKITGKYPYFAKYLGKKDSYNGMGSDVKVLAAPVILITNVDVPEDLVYKFTKTYWEHFDEVKKSAPFLETVNRENPMAGISIPLHPGAYKYWVEKGVEVPEKLKP